MKGRRRARFIIIRHRHIGTEDLGITVLTAGTTEAKRARDSLWLWRNEEKESAMNSENKNNHQSNWETCVVCGNGVEPGRGASRINHRGNTINLCGPACLQTFAEEPDPYIARLARQMRGLVLRESAKIEGLGLGQSEGFLVPYPVVSAKRDVRSLLAKPQSAV